jgi:serine/threonine-protein kinase
VFRIGLFGTIDIRDPEGGPLQGILAQPKRLALLAYLAAATPAGSHSRDTLLGLFWPELDQSHARNALSQALHFLRRWMGEDALIARSGDLLALDGTRVWVDVRAFSTALSDDRPGDALELYRGDLLPSLFLSGCAGVEHWLESERDRLRSRAAAAARRRAEIHEASARLTLATGCAERAIELGGGDERHLRRMLELLARAGDRAGAVRAYERWAATVADLGLSPEAETLTLMRRLRSDPARSQSATPNPPPFVEPDPPTSIGAAVTRLQVALAGTYRLEQEVGAGAMAVVMRACDLRHQRQVAIKILRPELTAAMGAERFLREIEIAAGLVHPHILPLHDSGEAAGVLYYVMPYIEGDSLRDRLVRERRLPLADAVRIAREVAAALGYAHTHGFVHRDIKPENILLAGYPPPASSSGEWNALVADFGIACAIGSAGGERATAGQSGTPAYMSPEQVLGSGAVDERSDIYALGCVLYEMLAGEPPFAGSLETQRLREPPKRLRDLRDDASPSLEAAVNTALERNPAARFTTAARFAQALAGVELPAASPRPGRHQWWAVASVLPLFVAGAIWAARTRTPHGRVPDTVQTIAMLPVRTSGDSGQNYLADGILAEVTAGLIRIDGLAVRPRVMVLAEVRKGGTPVEVGRRLGADWVIDGALHRAGSRSRFVVELIRVDRGIARWSHRYESPAADLFALRQSATTELARAIGVPLSVTVRTALARRETVDLAAREYYLRASGALNAPRTEAGLAADLFGRAIASDSTFAAAWAGLASAYQQLSQIGGASPMETLVLWRRATDRAIALDSLNGDAYAQRAQIHEVYEWDFPAADADFRRAVALSPGSAESFMSYAQFLNVVGLDDSALTVMRRAVTLSPDVSFRVANLTPRLRMVGRQAEATVEARRALALDSTLWVAHLMLAQLADDAGDLGEAAKEAERAFRLAGDLPFVLGTLARYYGLSGRADQAKQIRSRLAQLEASQHVQQVFHAEALIGVGDRIGALEALEASARNREPDLLWKLAYGHFSRLRTEPRYQVLLSRVGVSDHSRDNLRDLIRTPIEVRRTRDSLGT